MNEQINKLVKKVAPSFGENQKWAIVGESDIEQFVELIVRECAQMCNPVPGIKYSPNAASSRNECKQSILQHFGVKE